MSNIRALFIVDIHHRLMGEGFSNVAHFLKVVQEIFFGGFIILVPCDHSQH